MHLDQLRRITRDGRWIPEIDGLRFVAIASVFLYHLGGELAERSERVIPIEASWWWLGRVIGNGDRGVGLFFVISGMILGLPFARQYLLGSKAVSLRRFYLRRVTRLEPPYLASMLVALALVGVYQHGFGRGFGWHVLASAFYLHSLIYGTMSAVNPVAWSLEVEIQFYLLAPLFMQVFRIRRNGLRRGLMVAVVCLAGVAQMPFADRPRVVMSLLFYAQYFVAGLLVADVFALDLEGMRASWRWDAVGIAGLALMFWPAHDVFWAHGTMPVAAGLLCVAALRSVSLRRVFANRWIAVIGGMCYSIYLLHFLLIAVVFKATRYAILPGQVFFVNYAVQIVLVTVPVLAVCAAFFLLVERPCMDPEWPLRLWRSLTGQRGAEVQALDTGEVAE